MSDFLTYFNDPEVKQLAVTRAKEHENAGSIQQNDFGDYEIVEPGTARFKGCAVGCLTRPTKFIEIKDGFKDEYELSQFMYEHGIPTEYEEFAPSIGTGVNYTPMQEAFNFCTELSAVIDAVFENLDEKVAQHWPLRIVEAIPVGANLTPSRILEIVDEDWQLKELIYRRFDSYHSPPLPGLLDELEPDVEYEGEPDPEKAADYFVNAVSSELVGV